MKLLPATILTVAGLFILNKLTAAGAATRLNFLIGGVTLSNAGLSPVLNVALQVQNPTSNTYTVTAIVANITLNGEYIGNVSGFVKTVIGPGNSTLPLTVTLSVGPILSDIVQVLTGQAKVQAAVQLQGTMNVDNVLLPINVTYNAL